MRQTLRPARWLVVSAVSSGLLFVTAAVCMYQLEGWSYTSVGLALCSMISVGAIAELAMSRIAFVGETMQVANLWSVRSFRRDEIRSVKWEGGVGVSIEVENGKWLNLPDFGLNSQGVVNTVRAWLKKTE